MSGLAWQEGDVELASNPYWIDAHARKVRAWASFRPPFEPRRDTAPWHFRAQLREAVSKLVLETDDEIARCAYASSVTGLVDAENVLLYNLGSGYLAPAARSGVRFVRTFAEPPTSPVPLAPYGSTHYLEYGFTDSGSKESIKHGASLASWRDVPWPETSVVPKVSALWFALRTSNPSVHSRLDDPTALFGIQIEIAADGALLSPVHVLKPLLDAVVSAFHFGVNASDPIVTTYVARQIGLADPKQVETLLGDERFNVLGSRMVVGSYRNGVKWNPADERCVLAQVALTRRRGRATFSGHIFAVD
jgi:hypothetical protein